MNLDFESKQIISLSPIFRGDDCAPHVGTKFQRGDRLKSQSSILHPVFMLSPYDCWEVLQYRWNLLWHVKNCGLHWCFLVFTAKCIMGLLNLKINEYILFLCFLHITRMQPYVNVITFCKMSAVSKMDVFPLGMFLFVVHIFCWQTQFV